MTDVVEELRSSYESCPTPVVDADAVVARAMVQGAGARRARRFTAAGALVVVVSLVAALLVVTKTDGGVRVRTEGTAPTPTTLPVATVARFHDLSGLRKTAISAIAHDAANPALARAEVVKTTWGAFRTSTTPIVSDQTPDDLRVDVLQVYGTKFTCTSACYSLVRLKPGRAELFVWQPGHGVLSMGLRGRTVDLSELGPVYRIPLPPIEKRPKPVKPEVCTQADLGEPGIAMPAGEPVGKTTALGTFARLDPALGVTPRVSAATAWQTLTLGRPQPARSAQLLLGYYSSFVPAQGHVLVWVLRMEHLAYGGFQGGAFVASGTPTTQPPPCEFTNAYLVLDATTGKGIVDSYGG